MRITPVLLAATLLLVSCQNAPQGTVNAPVAATLAAQAEDSALPAVQDAAVEALDDLGNVVERTTTGKDGTFHLPLKGPTNLFVGRLLIQQGKVKLTDGRSGHAPDAKVGFIWDSNLTSVAGMDPCVRASVKANVVNGSIKGIVINGRISDGSSNTGIPGVVVNVHVGNPDLLVQKVTDDLGNFELEAPV